jgi:hypothetical protein
LALGIETGRDQPLAPQVQYTAVPAKIEAWLAERDLVEHIGRSNAAYYDRFLDPERVGEQIIRAVTQFASGQC